MGATSAFPRGGALITKRATVVVVGGGFGGMYAARQLERRLPAGTAEIVLANPENFMLYTPLLPEAASGIIEPRHVRATWWCRCGGCSPHPAADRPGDRLRRRRAHGHRHPPEGPPRTIAWDRLVLATGSVSRLPGIPGLAEHARGFKTLPEGIYLRNHVLRQFELADATDDPAERAARLTFVTVGAGYAGTELQALTARAIEAYPHLRVDRRRAPPADGGHPRPAHRRPRPAGGRPLHGGPGPRRRVRPRRHRRRTRPRQPHAARPADRPARLRQARACAASVAFSLGEGGRRRFDYRGLGVPISGFLGWFVTRSYHLAAMPTWGRRFRVGLDWAVALISPSDIAELGSLGRDDALAEREPMSGEPQNG